MSNKIKVRFNNRTLTVELLERRNVPSLVVRTPSGGIMTLPASQELREGATTPEQAWGAANAKLRRLHAEVKK